MIFLHKLYKTYQIIDKKYKHTRLKKIILHLQIQF